MVGYLSGTAARRPHRRPRYATIRAMSNNKGRGARILAEQRRRAAAKRPRPTFAEVLDKRDLVTLVATRSRAITDQVGRDADQLGRSRLRVVSCHDCTAPKGCCSLSTLIFLHDAVPLVAQLRRDGRDTPTLRAALAAAADRMEHSHRTEYRQPCVFLDEHERCTVYEVRPSTCATALVYSDPDCCNDRSRDVISFNAADATRDSMRLSRDFYAQLGIADRTGKSMRGVLPRMVLVVLELWDSADYQVTLANGDWAIRAAAIESIPTGGDR
jgi:Fe-S-cluster containining protein